MQLLIKMINILHLPVIAVITVENVKSNKASNIFGIKAKSLSIPVCSLNTNRKEPSANEIYYLYI